jgi:hypothetical protein
MAFVFLMFRPIIEKVLPPTISNVLLKGNHAFYRINRMATEKLQRKVATHQSERCLLIECLFVNSHRSLEVQLKHKISLMPSRNYNKKHFGSAFTKCSKIFLMRFIYFFPA